MWICQRRQSIENHNNQSDSTKHLRRSLATTATGNLGNELGWAIMTNGVALQRHRAKITADSAITAGVADTAPPGLLAA
ncbi:MAG: hypothetical protein ACXVGG_15560 [Mycobacteriaceae bacterium]